MVHFDPAMPQINLGRWFRRLVYPAVPNYERRDCDNAAAGAKTDAPKAQCIFVTAALTRGRFLNLKFVFDAGQGVYNYGGGSLVSSDPQNPGTKAVPKLSELEAMVQPELPQLLHPEKPAK